MRIFARFVVSLVALVLFLPFVFATTSRFLLFNRDFWIESLRADGVYQDIHNAIKTIGEKQKGEEADAFKLIANVKTDSIRDFTEGNIKAIFDFVEGEKETLSFYLPLKKLGIPTSIFPAKVANILTEQTDINALAPYFGGINAIDQKQLDQIKNSKNYATYSFIFLAFILTLVLFVHFRLGPKGRGFTGTGVLLVVMGIMALLLFGAGEVIRLNWIKEFPQSQEPSQVFLGAIAPPLMAGVFKLWKYIGTGTIILGAIFILFSFLKPTKKIKRKVKG